MNKNLTNTVWKIIDANPCIRRNLNLGLLNIRSVALYIINKYNLDGKVNAVISAIRRYDAGKFVDITKKANELLSHTTISTRSGLANVSLIKDSDVQNRLPKLFSLIHYNRGEVLRIIQADEVLKVLIDEKNLKKVREIFPKNKIVKIEKGIGEINLHHHPDAVNTPGMLSAISDELAMNEINVREVISCLPEMLFFVYEKDLLKAHQVLYKLCNPEK